MAGKQAHDTGVIFENILHRSALVYGYAVVDIPDGCRQLGANRLIRVPTPFDYVLTKSPRETIFCDAKCTRERHFPVGLIKPHQAEELFKLQKIGHVAGYIVNFLMQDATYFFEAHKLKEALLNRKSLRTENGYHIGDNGRVRLDLLFTEPSRPSPSELP